MDRVLHNPQIFRTGATSLNGLRTSHFIEWVDGGRSYPSAGDTAYSKLADSFRLFNKLLILKELI